MGQQDLGLCFEIKYVKRKHNTVVDALSLKPVVLSLMDVTHDWKAQLLVEYSKDKQACENSEGHTRMIDFR